jgi:hypothetical protein
LIHGDALPDGTVDPSIRSGDGRVGDAA